MIHHAHDLLKMHVTVDGDRAGTVDDVLIDDATWAVRHLVVRVGERDVLLPPAEARGGGHGIATTQAALDAAPGAETDLPVSARMRPDPGLALGWTDEGTGGPSPWGPGMVPTAPERLAAEAEAEAVGGVPPGPPEEVPGDPHLRSLREVLGYAVQASDGHAGRLSDLTVDDDGWRVTDLVVDTKEWWPGGKVHLPASAAFSVDWAERSVTVDATRDEVRHRHGRPD
ncbi:MAG: PRC-barrel domain-containing protein [Thermoleophilia bacterium]|nr:PRC-barrel domain-containing protein [Thermoleophilia bacterium]